MVLIPLETMLTLPILSTDAVSAEEQRGRRSAASAGRRWWGEVFIRVFCDIVERAMLDQPLPWIDRLVNRVRFISLSRVECTPKESLLHL